MMKNIVFEDNGTVCKVGNAVGKEGIIALHAIYYFTAFEIGVSAHGAFLSEQQISLGINRLKSQKQGENEESRSELHTPARTGKRLLSLVKLTLCKSSQIYPPPFRF